MTTAVLTPNLRSTNERLNNASAILNEIDFIGTIAGSRPVARFIGKDDLPLDRNPAPAFYLPASHNIYIHVHDAKVSVNQERLSNWRKTTDRDTATIVGLLAHECGHAAISDDMDAVIKLAPRHRDLVTLFEELRVENHAIRRSPQVRRYLRASFGLVLANLPDEFENTSHVVRAWAICRGRTLAGIAEPDETHSVDLAARTLLDDDTVDALTDLLQEALTLSLDHPGARRRMIAIADEWTDLVGEPAEATGCTTCARDARPGEATDDTTTGESTGTASGTDTKEGDSEKGSTLDIDGKTESTTTNSDTWGVAGGEHDYDAPGKDGGDPLDDEAAELMAAMTRDLAGMMQDEWQRDPKVGKRASSAQWAKEVFGNRAKDSRLSYSAPTAAMRQHVVTVAGALENLMLPTIAKTSKASPVPPGRLRSREALRASAERAGGRMVTAAPWRTTVRRHTSARPLVLGVATDTSGSMRWAERGVAEFAYVFTNAGHRVGARTAAVTFGDRVHRIARPGEIMDKVVSKTASDGTERCDYAMAALDGVLHLTDPGQAARILLVVSDGALVERGEGDKTLEWMKAMDKAGTWVVWISDADIDTGSYGKWLKAAQWLPHFMLKTVKTGISGTAYDRIAAAALEAITKHIR
jgi:hypothetical protein